MQHELCHTKLPKAGKFNVFTSIAGLERIVYAFDWRFWRSIIRLNSSRFCSISFLSALSSARRLSTEVSPAHARLPPGRFAAGGTLAAGAQGAFFQTDVEINNTGTEEAEVHFQWLPRGEDNSEPVGSNVIELGPGESERFENVLTELFGLEPDAVGALRLVASTGSVIGMSRTYNSPDGKAAGTFGQGLPAIRSSEMISGTEPRRIIFLSEDSDSRANVGCVNGSSGPVTIHIGVFNAAGIFLETKTMDLGPYSNNQINRVLEDWQPVNASAQTSAAAMSAGPRGCAFQRRRFSIASSSYSLLTRPTSCNFGRCFAPILRRA